MARYPLVGSLSTNWMILYLNLSQRFGSSNSLDDPSTEDHNLMKTTRLRTKAFFTVALSMLMCASRSLFLQSAIKTCRRSHHSQRQNLDCRQQSPTAQAVAVLGDRIVAVGSNAEIESWRGAHTRLIDADGKFCCRDLMTRMCTLSTAGRRSTSATERRHQRSEEFAVALPNGRRRLPRENG